MFLPSSYLGVFFEDCEFAPDALPSAVTTLFEALLVSELITLCDELLSSEAVLFAAFLPQPARAAAEKTNKNNRISDFFIAFLNAGFFKRERINFGIIVAVAYV